MEPVPKSLCEERHSHIDERCEMHKEDIVALEKKVNCLLKMQNRIQWLLIATLVALGADIIRGMYVLDAVTKAVKTNAQ